MEANDEFITSRLFHVYRGCYCAKPGKRYGITPFNGHAFEALPAEIFEEQIRGRCQPT